MSDLRWEQYLFESHTKAELISWARSLELFRFCRAYGGHANDGDSLLLAVRVESEGELVAVFYQLGIGVERLANDNPVPIAGVQYSSADFAKFVSGIREYPTIKQPGAVRIAGADVFAWVNSGRLELRISDAGNPFAVSTESITFARLVEVHVVPLSGKLIDPPQDNRNCICPKFYPEFWSEPI